MRAGDFDESRRLFKTRIESGMLSETHSLFDKSDAPTN